MSKGILNCNRDRKDCPCFYEPLTGEWYINVRTLEWDKYENDWVYEKFYVSYCPYCGKHLGED